jgi:hypothetical protein
MNRLLAVHGTRRRSYRCVRDLAGEAISMWIRRFLAALLVVTLAGSLSGPTVAAQTSQTFTIPGGGRAVIVFEAYCLDFGGAFPQTLQAPSAAAGLAPGNVRAALAYIQANNLSAQAATALQAQYAIWRLAGARGSPQGNQTANTVVAAGTTPPADPANATSIMNAGAAGSVALDTIAWGPIGSKVEITRGSTDNFYGRGQLVVRNRTQQQLTLFMPVGTIFWPGFSGSQRMTGYLTSVTVSPGQLPVTAGFDLRPLLALAAVALAFPIHLWRKRRERLIGRRLA